MKKFALIVLALVLVGGLAFAVITPWGLRLGGNFLAYNAVQAALAKHGARFLECIQYKNFDEAAGFHSKDDRKKANIPQLIERLFKVKPEFLDIRRIDVTRVTVDSAGSRARTYFRANVELLNSLQNPKEQKERKERDVEGILYWKKQDGEWRLDLQSSLR